MQEKRNFLFRFVSPTKRADLRFDDEALYSTTDQLTAEKMAKELVRYVPATAVVTDATACVGGSAYALAQSFKKVHAVELDPDRYAFLQHNVRLLGTNNIETHQGDALVLCKTIEQDLIFLDPPWGGPEYKEQKKVSLTLSGHDLSQVCIQLAPYTSWIAIKVPINFDTETFHKRILAGKMNLVTNITHLRKMHLLLLRCQSP